MTQYYVYFLANITNEVLYIGVTNNLARRLEEHQSGLVNGFTQKYRTHKLVYVEIFDNPISAITREKELKKWRREKKNALINNLNPSWDDLSFSLA